MNILPANSFRLQPAALKRVFLIGNIWLIIYCLGAVVLYKERIFLDGSYYFFHVVQQEGFHTEHQRFILAVSQVLAWTGVKLGLSLNTVLLLNSLNPVIYLWALFLFSIFWLKQEGIAWSLLMSSVCGIYFIYFIPMYEVWYGCVLLIFFAGVLDRKFYLGRFQLAVFSLLLLTLLFSYPLIFIGVIYLSAAHFINVKKIPRALLVVYALSFGVWLSWKYFFLSDYETGKIEYPLSQEGSILQNNFSHAGNFITWIKFFFYTYTEETIALIVSVFWLYWRKARIQAMLLLFISAGYLLLIGFFHDSPWHHSNYFERMYLLLVPLSMIPFFTRVYERMQWKMVAEGLALLVICWRGFQIADHSIEYKAHVKEIEMLINRAHEKGGSKFMADFTRHPELSSLDEWSLPMETLIFSSLENSEAALTVSWKADIQNPSVASRLNEKTFRLRLDEIYPDNWLNEKYFRLQGGSYQEIVW